MVRSFFAMFAIVEISENADYMSIVFTQQTYFWPRQHPVVDTIDLEDYHHTILPT